MQIDKQIPLPESRNSFFHIFSPMEVGDSVFIDNANHQSAAVVQARASAARWKWKLTARRENNGVRIWRVA